MAAPALKGCKLGLDNLTPHAETPDRQQWDMKGQGPWYRNNLKPTGHRGDQDSPSPVWGPRLDTAHPSTHRVALSSADEIRAERPGTRSAPCWS